MPCFRTRLLLAALSLGFTAMLSAQPAPAVEARTKSPVVVKRGDEVRVAVDVRVRDGLHINSHQPADKYYIPLKLSWESTIVEALQTTFPQAVQRAFAFSEGKQLSVFEGSFQVMQTFLAKPGASRGFGSATGKLSYQACNDKECFPPASVPVRVTFDLR